MMQVLQIIFNAISTNTLSMKMVIMYCEKNNLDINYLLTMYETPDCQII